MSSLEIFHFERAHLVNSYQPRGFPFSILPVELQPRALVRVSGNTDTLVVTHKPSGVRLNEAMTKKEATEMARGFATREPRLIHKAVPNLPGPMENEYVSAVCRYRMEDCCKP